MARARSSVWWAANERAASMICDEPTAELPSMEPAMAAAIDPMYDACTRLAPPSMAVPMAESSASPLGAISLDQPLRDARDEFERIYFEYHLGRENHSMTRVSERTGLERTHLYRKLKQLGIDASRRRSLASSSS